MIFENGKNECVKEVLIKNKSGAEDGQHNILIYNFLVMHKEIKAD